MLVLLLLLCVGFIVYATTQLKLHPFLALLAAALLFGLLSGMEVKTLLDSINQGFGNTLGGIGLLIILGVIIGAFLENSGGAFSMADKVIKWIGSKRLPFGMALIGYVVSIPVFADSGFILLTPLNKALTKKAGKSLAVTAVTLGLGLMASHVMVPPTPGPIAAAEFLGADLGQVILWGIIVSFVALLPGIWFANKFGSKIYIDPQPDIDEAQLEKQRAQAPSAGLSFLPIIVPILLIVIRSFNNYLKLVESGWLFSVIEFLGTPIIALLIGFGLAMLLPKKLEKEMLSTRGWVGKALKDAAIIIMITGAGGIFGKVLQNSDLPLIIQEYLGDANLGIWLPFIIAAALKSAQGSSTVAMLTTAPIIAPLMTSLGFVSEVDKALAVLAIGAGAACVSHANDSFFWVVSQMSNMSVSVAYRLHTIGTGVVGLSAGIIVYILSMIF
ncbi:MAG: GntP family permease [Bacteroidota bacterium]